MSSQPPADASIDPATADTDPSIMDLNYDEFKLLSTHTSIQHALIGDIRKHTPIEDQQLVDNWLLEKAVKVLQLAIFPQMKMMHVPPEAVKNMLDVAFMNSYWDWMKDQGPKMVDKGVDAFAPGEDRELEEVDSEEVLRGEPEWISQMQGKGVVRLETHETTPPKAAQGPVFRGFDDYETQENEDMEIKSWEKADRIPSIE